MSADPQLLGKTGFTFPNLFSRHFLHNSSLDLLVRVFKKLIIWAG